MLVSRTVVFFVSARSGGYLDRGGEVAEPAIEEEALGLRPIDQELVGGALRRILHADGVRLHLTSVRPCELIERRIG